MNKIYILAHKHVFEDGHKEGKLIGAFFSKQIALKTLEKYKNLEGFRDNLEGFYIQEMILDKLAEKELNKVIKKEY